MLKKSVVSGATLIVPDIEDSVPVAEKPKARHLVNQYLPFIRENAIEASSVIITPRTNQPSLPSLWDADIQALFYEPESCPQVFDGLCVPKIDQVEDIKKVHDVLEEVERKGAVEGKRFKIIAQIESAASMVNMKDIFSYDLARSQKLGMPQGRIIGAAFGADDFTADLGVHRSDNDRSELDFARRLFALTCAAYPGIVSIDTPYVQFRDPEGLREELRYLKTIGMKAKLAIHPTQVPVINSEMIMSQDDLDYYEEMIRQFERAQVEDKKAAIVYKEKMVDIAAYRRALELVKRRHSLSKFVGGE